MAAAIAPGRKRSSSPATALSRDRRAPRRSRARDRRAPARPSGAAARPAAVSSTDGRRGGTAARADNPPAPAPACWRRGADAECIRTPRETLVFGDRDEDPQARERRAPICGARRGRRRERWETRPAAAGAGGAAAPFFRRWIWRFATGRTLLIIRRSTDHTPPGAAGLRIEPRGDPPSLGNARRRGCAVPSATLNSPSALLTACIAHTLTMALEPSPRNPRHRRALMNASRLVSLAAALVITATEAAFFSLPLHTPSLNAVAAPVASHRSGRRVAGGRRHGTPSFVKDRKGPHRSAGRDAR